jgi:hypothetical protein
MSLPCHAGRGAEVLKNFREAGQIAAEHKIVAE